MVFFSYVYRSLLARFRANVVTVLSVALFVTGGSLGLGVYKSLRQALVETAPPENILVLGEGASVETGSRLDLEGARQVVLLDGVKRDGQGPLAARELVVGVHVDTTDLDRYEEPFTIRGIDERSLEVHHAQVIQGAAPKPGTLELMVGRKVAAKFPSLAVGSEFNLPGGAARISGVFAANDGPYELELWTPRAALELHVKDTTSNSITIVAEDAGKVPALVEKINTTKALDLHAVPLGEYRAAGAGLSGVLRIVLVLLVLLSVVATTAIATTMSAAIRVRMPELAAMVAIGIRRSRLIRLVIFESTLLAAAGALLGVLASEVIRRAIGTVQLGDNLVQLSAAPLVGLVLAIVVGLIGGLAPARATWRLNVLETLR